MKVIIYSEDPEVVTAATEYADSPNHPGEVIDYAGLISAGANLGIAAGETIIVFAHGVKAGGLRGDAPAEQAFIGDAGSDQANGEGMRTDARTFAALLDPHLPAGGVGRILIQACESAEVNIYLVPRNDSPDYRLPDSFAGELARELTERRANGAGPAIDVAGRLGKPAVDKPVPHPGSPAWRTRALWLNEGIDPDMAELARRAPEFPQRLLAGSRIDLAEFLRPLMPEAPDSPHSSDADDSPSESDTDDPDSRGKPDTPGEESPNEHASSGEQGGPLSERRLEEDDYPGEHALPGR